MSTIRNAQYFLSFLLAAIIISCTRDANTVITIPSVINSAAAKKFERSFMNTSYGSVKGSAEIVKQDSIIALKLENFWICNASDLRTDLSNDVPPANFIDLGSLRSTSGEQAYAIRNHIDLTQYEYALIHCNAHNHLFRSGIQQ